jgi:hypothetical protein
VGDVPVRQDCCRTCGLPGVEALEREVDDQCPHAPLPTIAELTDQIERRSAAIAEQVTRNNAAIAALKP